ncbi:hypothetical protein C7451_1153 [Blastomonas natatoria]|uniref:Thioredoxin-like protein n=1 Tax=Blastomonas natatoria TaxID=34015 RepID=A0A2V3UU33_9SPHN|nr:hypothetical protein C7451_1153 [Blastomonas natatoria]
MSPEGVSDAISPSDMRSDNRSSKRRAVNEAYDGGAITSGRRCDTSGLDANEAFARQHGFTGTPVIVRDDGAVLHGFRPREFLETWLKEKVS